MHMDKQYVGFTVWDASRKHGIKGTSKLEPVISLKHVTHRCKQ